MRRKVALNSEPTVTGLVQHDEDRVPICNHALAIGVEESNSIRARVANKVA